MSKYTNTTLPGDADRLTVQGLRKSGGKGRHKGCHSMQYVIEMKGRHCLLAAFDFSLRTPLRTTSQQITGHISNLK